MARADLRPAKRQTVPTTGEQAGQTKLIAGIRRTNFMSDPTEAAALSRGGFSNGGIGGEFGLPGRVKESMHSGEALMQFPHINELGTLSENQLFCLQRVKEVLVEYGETDTFIIGRGHHHFEVKEGEVMLKRTDKELRHQEVDVYNISDLPPGISLIPTQWAFTRQGENLILAECIEYRYPGQGGHIQDFDSPLSENQSRCLQRVGEVLGEYGEINAFTIGRRQNGFEVREGEIPLETTDEELRHQEVDVYNISDLPPEGIIPTQWAIIGKGEKTPTLVCFQGCYKFPSGNHVKTHLFRKS